MNKHPANKNFNYSDLKQGFYGLRDMVVHWDTTQNQTHNRQVPSSSLGGATISKTKKPIVKWAFLCLEFNYPLTPINTHLI